MPRTDLKAPSTGPKAPSTGPKVPSIGLEAPSASSVHSQCGPHGSQYMPLDSRNSQHSQCRLQCSSSALPELPIWAPALPVQHMSSTNSLCSDPSPCLLGLSPQTLRIPPKNNITSLPLPLLVGGCIGSQDQAPPSELHPLPREERKRVSGGTLGSRPGGTLVSGRAGAGWGYPRVGAHLWGGDEGQPVGGAGGQQPHGLALVEGQCQSQAITHQEHQPLQRPPARALQRLQCCGGNRAGRGDPSRSPTRRIPGTAGDQGQ